MRSVPTDLTARRAAWIIAASTLVIGVAGGLLMTVLDRKEFPTIGLGLWWAMQTITTVGYGDTVPHSTEGRILAVLVMVVGIGLTSVVTAAITAVFIESARRKRGGPDRVQFHAIDARLERIEQMLSVLDDGLEADQGKADRGGERGVGEG